MSKIYKFLLATSMVFSLSCSKKSNPVIPNEEEVITTLIYTLSSTKDSNVVLMFEDLDGDGGNDPVITVSGVLNSTAIYTGKLELLNKYGDKNDDIAKEVKEEAEEHQLFFESTLATFEYKDIDKNNKPLGLETTVKDLKIGTGELRIILRHAPNKNGEGVSEGKIEHAGGETDIEVSFDIKVI